MPDGPIIDIAVGLIFFYLLLSLVVSSVQEWITSLFGIRSKNLYKGIQRFVGNDYAQKIYQHPLVRNLSEDGKRPSYIDPETLSKALLAVVAEEQKLKLSELSIQQVRDMLKNIDGSHPLYGILDGLLEETDKTVNDLKKRLAEWFDEGMVRISGWYNRRIRWMILLQATVVTVGLNASTIHIAEKLWTDDALRTQLAQQAREYPENEDGQEQQTQDEQLNQDWERLKSFPIGWNKNEDKENIPLACAKTVFGWFLTIMAVSLGAPFWFDLLKKVANIKGSGGQKQAARSERNG